MAIDVNIDIKNAVEDLKNQRTIFSDADNKLVKGVVMASNLGTLANSISKKNYEILKSIDDTFLERTDYIVDGLLFYEIIRNQYAILDFYRDLRKFINDIKGVFEQKSKDGMNSEIDRCEKFSMEVTQGLELTLSDHGCSYSELDLAFSKKSMNEGGANISAANERNGVDVADENLIRKKAELSSALDIAINELIHFSDSEKQRATQYVDDEIGKIGEKIQDLNKLVALAAGNRLGVVFEANANKEEKKADEFRKYSIIMMFSVGMLFILNFLIFEFDEFTKHDAYMRVAIGVFFSFVIAYLVRQSAVHRNQQYIYLQKALDVTAISPYISDLPTQDQYQIKKLIAERIFVPAGQACQESGSLIPTDVLTKILDRVDLKAK
jgi:hypothetical protein